MGPCARISWATVLNHMTIKIILHLMNSLNIYKLSWTREAQRNYLMLISSSWKIWEEVKSDVKNLALGL